MENRINIAEILKDCPTGMELDCTMFENVTFVGISNGQTIVTRRESVNNKLYLDKYGCPHEHPKEDLKCIIFPKGKDTWEGFIPPCKFKDGDIVATDSGLQVFILQKAESNTKGYCYTGYDFEFNESFMAAEWKFDRLATEEEKQKLFDAIKANGYIWNAKAKTLEKLIEPKFKVGDKIQHKNGRVFASVLKIKADCYIAKDSIGDHFIIYFTHQDNYELILNKFDISTLIPFESRVLVRNSKDQYWIPAFWGFRAKDGYVTTFGHCNYCIPYEANKELRGTTDDCDEFYKTWE